ncbi:MAG: hypothetical protein M1503_09640 [Thaumarchaeota archaeon]|nr:hypothetical protein [Nitrososphaerota archaeon]MCL5318501.1 hypothetical protein [Nitrososphaerota archaeon]
MLHGRENNVAFILTAIPGLLGLFGLGHLYLGARKRAYVFLAVTAVLYIVVVLGLLYPQFVPALIMAPVLPAAWALGYLAELYDARETARRRQYAEVARER